MEYYNNEPCKPKIPGQDKAKEVITILENRLKEVKDPGSRNTLNYAIGVVKGKFLIKTQETVYVDVGGPVN